MRNVVRSALVALLIGTLTVPLAAQDIRPLSSGPERSGFWWGIGLGAASVKADCDGCASVDNQTFPMLDIRLGGTLSQSLRIGVEVTGGAKKDAFFQNPNVTENVGNVNVSAYFYPSSQGNFWLQGGLAGVVFRAKEGGTSNTAEAVSGGLIVGAGFDLRFGSHTSITPSLRFVGGGGGDMTDQDGSVFNTGWKTSYAQASVAIVWH